jgi:hypothetical protein
MTDGTPFPSAVQISVGGEVLRTVDLADDPADHRGILSWHSQIRREGINEDEGVSFRRFKGGELNEAGSYGYLVSTKIPDSVLARAEQTGMLEIRLSVDDSLGGGLAIYGEKFGRYPLDPTLVFSHKTE